MLKFSAHTSGLSVIPERLKAASEKAEHIVAIQVQKDTSPYVPALTGDLDRRTKVDGSLVIYPGPESRMLYHGKLMVDPETGSAYAKKGGTKVVTDKDLVFNKAMHSQAQAYWFEASKAENMDKWLRVADKAVKRDI